MAVADETNVKYRAALAVARRLHEAGHHAYFAGGCVRDLLLGVKPKDYDVATSAKPEEVIAFDTGPGNMLMDAVAPPFDPLLVQLGINPTASNPTPSAIHRRMHGA